MNISMIKQESGNAAQWLKLIAHPDRLFVLCQLIGAERCVGELLESSHLSQSAFSQHLTLLRTGGLVKTRKEAQTVYYSLADENVIELIQLLQKIFCPKE